MLGAVSGEMTPVQFGVYWMICTLIYSRRASVPNDPVWLAGRFHRSTDTRTIKASIEALLKMKGGDGKSRLELLPSGELMVNRCRDELEMAANRMRTASENGVKSGQSRNRNKENQDDAGTTFKSENELSPSPSPSPSPRTPIVPKGTKYSLEFETFWEAWPHKVGKDAAWRKWQDRKADRPPIAAILVAIDQYRRTKPHDRAWCNPATWIHQGRWGDQPAAPDAPPQRRFSL